MPFFRNIEGCAKFRKLTISKWRMVKYPENIWVNMREYLYELKWKKKRKMKIQDYTFLRVGRYSFDFNIAKLCAPSNNCAQKRYFGTMKFRDNVITDALCAYCFFFFFISRFPRILRVSVLNSHGHRWPKKLFSDCNTGRARYVRRTGIRKQEYLRDWKIWFA